MLLGRRDGGSTQGYMEADQAPLIEADAGPYKVPPTDRQGMAVEGEGEVIHEAVRGQDPGAVIDMGALPEEPIGRPRDLLPPQGPPAPPPAAPAGQKVEVQVLPTGPPPATAQPPRPAAQSLPASPPAVAAKPAAAPAPARPLAVPPPAATRPPPAASKPPAPLPPLATSGSKTVQIGAFSSEAKAEEEWARVAAKGGLTGKRIEKLTSSSGKTLWRVRGTAADPDAACKAILAVKGACEVKK
jgi:cell division protein FtsN